MRSIKNKNASYAIKLIISARYIKYSGYVIITDAGRSAAIE